VLDRAQVDAWRELCVLADEEPGFAADVEWTQAARQPDGTWLMGYVTYHGRLSRATSLLSFVGAVTPAYRWMDYPVPERAAEHKPRGPGGYSAVVLRSLAASYRAGAAGPVNGS
jgi:hypothetical protein